MVDLIRVAAWSALSAAPSITSNPNSPAPDGVSLLASSAATRFTSASSDPTTAWMFALGVFVFALGIAGFIASAAKIDKVRARVLVSACRDRVLCLSLVRVRRWKNQRRRLFRRDAETSTRDACATQRWLHARAAASDVACVSHRSSFRFDFIDASTAFYFHYLITQQSRAFEFQICRSLLHFLLKFTQQFGQIEIAAGLT